MKILKCGKRIGFHLHVTTIQLTKDLMVKPHQDKKVQVEFLAN